MSWWNKKTTEDTIWDAIKDIPLEAPIEEHEQSEDTYYCGTCRGFISIADPCVHHSLVR
jgi:hypothetical protein